MRARTAVEVAGLVPEETHEEDDRVRAHDGLGQLATVAGRFCVGNGGERGVCWKHASECIRVSYTMDAETVESGIKVIAEEVNRLFTVH